MRYNAIFTKSVFIFSESYIKIQFKRMFLFVGFSFKFASELFAEHPKKIGVTLFDWLSYILPWLFHFKSYASRQQRTASITRFSFSAFCCFFLQSLIISARFFSYALRFSSSFRACTASGR